MKRRKDSLAQLCERLKGAGATMTFSQHCRSGLIGDMCRCWRCRGLDKALGRELGSARDAKLADRAFKAGFQLRNWRIEWKQKL